MGTHIRTLRYKEVDFLNPDLSEVSIQDIIDSLVNVNRFTGHTLRPYPVLEHLIRCHDQAELEGRGTEARKSALMHDTPEFAVTDVASPLKQLIPDYRKYEDLMERAIEKRFNFKVIRSLYKDIDIIACRTESVALRTKARLVNTYDWDFSKLRGFDYDRNNHLAWCDNLKKEFLITFKELFPNE